VLTGPPKKKSSRSDSGSAEPNLNHSIAPKKTGTLRRIFRLVSLLLTVGVIVVAVLLAWSISEFNAPGPSADVMRVVLPKGAGLRAIAQRLYQAGVIRRSDVFIASVRLNGHAQDLQAGEFDFAPGITPRAVMERLVRGETVVRRLTVPEGLVVPQVLALIEKTDGLDGSVADGQVALPSEGSLLPETYHYAWGDDRRELLARMQRDRHRELSHAWAKRAPDLPLRNSAEALVLASIVERETGLAAERPHIAGVFINRLRRGMRLQSDPTVAYGLKQDGPLDRPLTRADLKSPHPFNTYLHKGLPPGPIANPGRASLEAVLHPLKTADLYFVADGTGGHVFAETLQQHNRNVAKWRKILRERKTQ